MTIKEYLKDHSERELVDKILSCVRFKRRFSLKEEFKSAPETWMALNDVDTSRTLNNLSEGGFKIEEPDYLAKAREFFDIAAKDVDNGLEKWSTLIVKHLKGLYEKAIKQLQEKVK